jgi:hypothetical protein
MIATVTNMFKFNFSNPNEDSKTDLNAVSNVITRGW